MPIFESMTDFNSKLLIPTLPEDPGVYRYFDEADTIIYIGKAKNLKNRISSYFTNQKNQDNKTRRLSCACGGSHGQLSRSHISW